MSRRFRDPELADRPQPSTVAFEPATAENCAADYAERTGTTAPHPSSYHAAPHTHGRR
jgi:hypothetical protein